MAGGSGAVIRDFLRKGLFFALRCPRVLLAIWSVVILLALLAVLHGSFGNDIARMLPDDSESSRSYRKIRESAMFNKVMILLETEETGLFESDEFAEKYDKLAAELLKESAAVRRVDHRLYRGDLAGSLKELPMYGMLFCKPEALPSPEKLPGQLMKELMKVSAIGRSELLQLDPANMSKHVLTGLENFRNKSQMYIAVDSQWIMSSNRKYLLLTAETVPDIADPASGKILQKIFDSAIKKADLPHGIKTHIIMPHKRAEANERVIKSDIKLATIMTLVLFTLLTLILYRGDWRSFLIPLMTFPGALISMGLLVVFFKEPQLFVVGLGGVVISIAIDYGVHIYGAMNSRQPYRTLTVLLPSLFIGMITSSAAFLLFVFSGMEGVRQLGFFAGCTLAVTMLIMLWLLPWCLRRKHKELELPFLKTGNPLVHRRITTTIFGAAALLSAMLLPQLKLHSDVRQYDMSPASFDQEEQLISKIFQNNRSAGIALVEGSSAAEALERAGSLKHKNIFTAAELFPPPSKAEENLEAWRSFDLADYAGKLRNAGQKCGFPANYFDNFINMLEKMRSGKAENIKTPALISDLKQRLLVKGINGKWHTVVMYDEKSDAGEYLSSFEYCTVISRERIPRVMAADIMRGILPAGCLAVAAVLLLTWLYFGSVVKALLAMLPVGCALLFTAGIYALIGKSINIPVMAAGVILCGLAVDYGIFVQHAIAVGREKTVFNSVTVSAMTTLAGGLTVAFARHPMMHDAGITLMIGIASAWASAIFLLPCLVRKRS